MSDIQIGFAGLAIMVVLMLLYVPVGVALGLVGALGIFFVLGSGAMWGIITAIPYDFAAHWTLSSVPMFLLMGYVAYHAKLTDGLFRMARLWLSALPGGLAIASIGGAAGFSAVTGSSLACAAAMGRIAVPEMLRYNYDKGLASGVVAAAGTIGSMIPPSIMLLIYGVFAEVPIGKLFVAGVIPGILTAFMFALMVVARVKINPSLAPSLDARPTWSERFVSLGETWPIMVIIISVIGGLFLGVFTPTEAGAVGAFMSFVVAGLRRKLNFDLIKKSVSETLVSTASIFVIAIGAAILTRFLALTGVPDFLSDFVLEAAVNPLTILLGMAVVYIILGMFLDPIGIMLLTLPIFLPVVEAADINLVWFGILIAKFLEIALITPPVGLNVFVIKGIVGDAISTVTIFKGIVWFLVADLITMTLLIVFPQLSLWLPALMN
ncbi:TRAP transporter large permease [Sneathiella sp. HT1-7]|jgi:tripartite ATP-independent transporter DctM subunit|uniref:TRAP transporter large permease n=1 Tax=Sneathiella sp. HT1-7 TaxID=2887192 RepID=UPI001D14D240|nr:TRAP transporter large permease [Sneathiella sp. HT1-7]MCC3306368.1 TRAP transporter large permease [Sneathiella sp. HT1-7]